MTIRNESAETKKASIIIKITASKIIFNKLKIRVNSPNMIRLIPQKATTFERVGVDSG